MYLIILNNGHNFINKFIFKSLKPLPKETRLTFIDLDLYLVSKTFFGYHADII